MDRELMIFQIDDTIFEREEISPLERIIVTHIVQYISNVILNYHIVWIDRDFGEDKKRAAKYSSVVGIVCLQTHDRPKRRTTITVNTQFICNCIHAHTKFYVC